jgi:hypothetical protein
MYKNLDKLYQQVLIKNNPISIIGGKTDVIHHFVPKSHGLSIRWYVPNGIPLTNEQHRDIHGKNRAVLEKEIILRLGRKWRSDLRMQQNKIAKYLNFESVKSHINGEIENYVN